IRITFVPCSGKPRFAHVSLIFSTEYVHGQEPSAVPRYRNDSSFGVFEDARTLIPGQRQDAMPLSSISESMHVAITRKTYLRSVPSSGSDLLQPGLALERIQPDSHLAVAISV